MSWYDDCRLSPGAVRDRDLNGPVLDAMTRNRLEPASLVEFPSFSAALGVSDRTKGTLAGGMHLDTAPLDAV